MLTSDPGMESCTLRVTQLAPSITSTGKGEGELRASSRAQ